MMQEIYIEIFLGISIGVFAISMWLLISLICESMKANTVCETVSRHPGSKEIAGKDEIRN